MNPTRLAHIALGTWTTLNHLPVQRRKDERGLSQSTENVILLVGAVAIAVIVIGLVRTFVVGRLRLVAP